MVCLSASLVTSPFSLSFSISFSLALYRPRPLALCPSSPPGLFSQLPDGVNSRHNSSSLSADDVWYMVFDVDYRL